MIEFLGNYKLVEKLAHGGMAEVFLGVRPDAYEQDSKVVVKRILPELGRDERFVAMFLNEAQLAAQMSHPNIVKVFEFGEDKGRLFMVMEFVDGMDCWRFSHRLENWGDQHVGAAVYILRQVLDALNYAHNMKDVNGKLLNVVHRDLSPSNIYLSKEGDVKLGDFGIARIDSNRYRPVEIIPKGKFGYMAPEQVEGRRVDVRADVYSAGVVLTELLIQQQLFSGSSQLSVMLDIRDGRLDRLEKNAGKIPSALLQIIEGALARNPVDRFRTAAEFGEALMAYQSTLISTTSKESLAGLVNLAVEAKSKRLSSSTDLGAIAETLAGNEVVGMQVTKPDGVTDVCGIGTDPVDGGTPITMELEHFQTDGRYWAKLSDQSTVGPTSFAHLIELIYSDKVDGNTLISADGRSYVPARDYSELSRHLPVYTPTWDVEDVNAPKRRGFLEMETPVNVLLTLAASKETGLLVCQTEGKRKEVYIRNGFSLYVGSNDSSELLGEYLVQNKIIERMELEMALALLPKFHGHLGDTLIALGMLTAVELFRHISDQIRHRLDDLLSWKKGKYEFFEGTQVRTGILEVPTELVSFVRDRLLQDMQHIDHMHVLSQMPEHKVAPTPLSRQIIDEMNLPSEIDEKIRSVASWHRISELSDAVKGSPVLLARAIYVALEAGLWTYEGPLPPWRQ